LFLDLVNPGVLWTSRKINLKAFNALSGTFSEGFDAAIRHVSDVPHYLMMSGCALSKETVAYPLDVTAYQKLARYESQHIAYQTSEFKTGRS